MVTARIPLHISLFSCMGDKGASYTKAGVPTLRKLLKSWHNKTIGDRWTYKLLADFEEEGFISRKIRTKRLNDGTIRRFSSIRSFKAKGLLPLVRLKVKGALQAWKIKIAGEREENLKQPTREEYLKQRNEEMDEQESRGLKTPAEKVTEKIRDD